MIRKKQTNRQRGKGIDRKHKTTDKKWNEEEGTDKHTKKGRE